MIVFRFLARTVTGLAALSSVVSAYPVASRHIKRQDAGGLTDIDILQFALTLEHLEAAFYKQGLEKFPVSDFKALGFSDETINNLVHVGETEATHVTFLMGAITASGKTPVPPCTYNFGFTDAASMVATAKVLEAVGVSAYLGAAPLVKDKAILSAAASIVTVESRHQTFLRVASGEKAIPQAFDVAISGRQVFTLAAQFITECPPEANLNIQAFPPLVINNAGTTKEGSVLTLADPNAAPDGTFCAFQSGAGAPQFAAIQGGSCTVPSGLSGETYVTLTTDGASVADEKTVAGPAVIVLS